MKIKTDWSKLSAPYICGLIATNPSKYSCTLHNAGFKFSDLNFTYHSFKVFDLKQPIETMIGMGFRGYSVTIPFKEEAIKFLDAINIDASEIGAVNTIINNGNQLFGFNTDWLGIKNSLLEARPSYSNCSALIIGAGGAARAAIYALQKMNVSNITIVNRTLRRAKDLSQIFHVGYLDFAKLKSNKVNEYDLIINATPQLKIPYFPYKGITEKHVIYEMITADTELTIVGDQVGATVIPGIRMLLHQGFEQFHLFTEKSPPKEDMTKSLISFFEENKNGTIK